MEEEKKKKKKNAGSSGALSFLAWNLIFGQDLPGPVIAGRRVGEGPLYRQVRARVWIDTVLSSAPSITS